MLSNLVETFILAGIAFFLINKLISLLGNVNDRDLDKKSYKSFFGEPNNLKDVTNTVGDPNSENLFHNPVKQEIQELEKKGLIDSKNHGKIESGVLDIQSKVPNFGLTKFVEVVKKVVSMIIKAAQNNDNKTLASLIDKRFLEKFYNFEDKYTGVDTKYLNLDIKILDIYSFGNSMFIKLDFAIAGKNKKNLKEEWTFTKTATFPGNEWYLSNIDKAS